MVFDRRRLEGRGGRGKGVGQRLSAISSTPPHSISLAVFEAGDAAPAQSLWLEFYDDDGLGQFSRRI